MKEVPHEDSSFNRCPGVVEDHPLPHHRGVDVRPDSATRVVALSEGREGVLRAASSRPFIIK